MIEERLPAKEAGNIADRYISALVDLCKTQFGVYALKSYEWLALLGAFDRWNPPKAVQKIEKCSISLCRQFVNLYPK